MFGRVFKKWTIKTASDHSLILTHEENILQSLTASCRQRISDWDMKETSD